MSGAVVIPGRRERALKPSDGPPRTRRLLTTLEARAFVVWRRAGLDPTLATVALARELADPALRDLVAAETVGAIMRSRASAGRAFARGVEASPEGRDA